MDILVTHALGWRPLSRFTVTAAALGNGQLGTRTASPNFGNDLNQPDIWIVSLQANPFLEPQRRLAYRAEVLT